ncbi:MAG: hypothetical protein ACKV2T_08070 [Kofleriaceae bacterium]
MLDPAHPITAFFDDNPERVLASLPAIEHSSGLVKNLDTLYRKAGEPELRGHRDGLFDPRIFANGFGHIETTGVVHPSIYPRLVEIMSIDTPEIQAIARGEKQWRDGKVMDDEYAKDESDLSGPHGIAEIVRRARPGHPLLPLCTITKIPVPPLAARPLHPSNAPEAIDAWIGPVNEAWLDVLRLARQDIRLHELDDTPQIILTNTSGRLQHALDRVYQRTRHADGWLVPPMVRGVDESVVAIVYAGPERIVIQRSNGVRVVDVSGREVHVAPPCGCILRGTIDNRYAVFHDFQRDLYPFNDEEGLWPPDIADHMSRIAGPLSVLDVHVGAYLERAPTNMPRTFVENGEPEELFLGGRSLEELGGDRPVASAYTNDLRFAEVSGDSTQIISLATGLTFVRPATTYPDEIEKSLDLTTGEVVEHEWDDQGGGGASAVAFVDGRWFTFDHYGVLCDHIGNEAIVIVPMASAAAFDPAGTRLALVVGDELVIIDRVARAIVSRFPA